ncbi:MAG: hypothetical protein OXC93_05775 [Rhodospirillaceae bacterium]|nr:hypothetical protein [Rhodospirillaceae bacterium]
MTTDPMFTLYVVWHPSYREGEQIADLLRTHPGRDLYRSFGAWCSVRRSVLQ